MMTWEKLCSDPAEPFETIAAAYTEPHRKYHNLAHLRECFDALDALAPISTPAIEIAVWYHDIVYDTHAADNEARSAARAERALRKINVEEALVDRVNELILATRHTQYAPSMPETNLIVDIDLAILGAAPERFDEYERQIREEYHWVDEGTFRAARAGIIADFFSRQQLYKTPAFFRKYERQAKHNLKRSLEKLSKNR